MDNKLIKKLILDDSFLYSEIKKLSNQIRIEENKNHSLAIELAAEQLSFYIYQSKEKILYRFYDYDEKISFE
jgi:hypothetical protein